MIELRIRPGDINTSLNPALVLYLFAAITSVVTILIIRPLFQITSENWAEYYRAFGELVRIWGLIFGTAFLATFAFLILRGILTASTHSFVLRLMPIEKILLILFLCNLGWGILGLLLGFKLSYIVGDTIRGAFIPGIYWIVRKSINSTRSIVFLARTIIIVETLLLLLLVPLGFIPFSFAGRTFLTTIFLTLLFEEKNNALRVLFSFLLLFGIYTILTTSAVRGIIIIFISMIVLNYIFRLKEIKLGILIFVFLIPAAGFLAAYEFLDLGLKEGIEFASTRFEESVGASGRNRYYGLDESLFQRVGETIDVWRTFQSRSPFFLASGLGNGAELKNYLITPSERWVYKKNTKHNIYITPVAILFRNGIIGLLLYGALAVYISRILFRIRRYRRYFETSKEVVLLKVLCLYQISCMLGSLISYWYVGNIIVAFTLPLIEFLRQHMNSLINGRVRIDQKATEY